MAIVLDLITDAMKSIGALAVGEQPTADEAQDALGVLNDMIDMWSTESLMVYAMQQQTFAFVAGQSTYTLGTGGNWNTARPDGIEAVYARDTQGNDFKIYLTRNFEEYSDIVSKQVTTNLPSVAFDNGGVPLRTLTFWPVPSDTTYTPVIWTWQAVNEFATINDTVIVPPGYRKAIQDNLAIELCPRYGVKDTALLEKAAAASKAQVKRANTVPQNLTMPSDIMGSGRWFNYLTGQTS